ncbi:ras guanine nucleotide exchange factor domain-containing protein [Gaertneriomyces semiglobifer]|nr:ras guanine nucleotide exchange factor domain-containing protein [Gaertneriomyces semiglobifer]
MSLAQLISSGDVSAVRSYLSSLPSSSNERTFWRNTSQGTLLHLAAGSSAEILSLLLQEPDVLSYVNAVDSSGSTPLHVASACGDFESARLLVESGADVTLVNVHGMKAADYARDDRLDAYLSEREAALEDVLDYDNYQINDYNRSISVSHDHPPRRVSSLPDLAADLPSDVSVLKGFIIDLIVTQSIFQERCKETIRQLCEEKWVALHKLRLLEQAAGIGDRETGERFIDQLSYLQDENERMSASVAYLKIRIQMLESAAAQQDEYYRKNLTDLTRQHSEQVQAIFRRNEETEKAFLAYQKTHADEIAELQRLRADLKSAGKSSKNAPANSGSTEMAQLQFEIMTLRKELATMTAEKLALEERLKLTEKLRSISETENASLRTDMSQLRKVMQEEVLKQLQEAREERDEVDESSGEVVFNKGEGGVKRLKGATPHKLVERLIDPVVRDHTYTQTMLLTHQSFLPSMTLLQHLTSKYISLASPISDEAVSQSPVLSRIVEVLKVWIETYFEDFVENLEMMGRLEDFMKQVRGDRKGILEEVVTRARHGATTASVETAMNRDTTERPKPILPKPLAKRYLSDQQNTPNASREKLPLERQPWAAFKSPRTSPGINFPTPNFGNMSGSLSLSQTLDVTLKFTDLDPLELARQLTLVEFSLFYAISPREFLDLKWMKASKENDAPNILRMTRWSNHVVKWVVSEIVGVRDSVKARASVMERVILFAQALEKLQNFNAVKEVLAALSTSAVYRLKKTKALLPSKLIKSLEELSRLVSSELNYKNLRQRIRSSTPPLIPFPGLYQGDLVFLDTCHRDWLRGRNGDASKAGNTSDKANGKEGPAIVNYHKMESVARCILEVEAYRKLPYSLEPVAEIQDYIRNFEPVDDDTAYDWSLICEPKPST